MKNRVTAIAACFFMLSASANKATTSQIQPASTESSFSLLADLDLRSLRGLVVEQVVKQEKYDHFRIILRSPEKGEAAAHALLERIKKDLPGRTFRKNELHYFDYSTRGTQGDLGFWVFVVLGDEVEGDTFRDPPYANGPDGVPYVVLLVSKKP